MIYLLSWELAQLYCSKFAKKATVSNDFQSMNTTTRLYAEADLWSNRNNTL